MGWLEDLIGPAGESPGFEDWLTPPDFSYALPDFDLIQSGGERLSQLNPFINAEPELSDFGGIQDIYHGLMTPFGAGKELVDQSAANIFGEQNRSENEAGQVLYENVLEPAASIYGIPQGMEALGLGDFTRRAGEGIGGLLTDPTTYALPTAPGALFAPGMAEQLISGLSQGDQEGYADALIGGLGLGLIGAPHIGRIPKEFNPLESGQRGSIEFGPKPDIPIIPESVIPDEPLNRPSVEMMKTEDLSPFLEYDRAIAPDERYNTLLESIRNEGIKEPLTLDMVEGEPRLAEGNRRAAIAKELGIGEVPVEALTDEMQFIKPSELLESVKSPEPIESLVPETPQIERRIETAEPKIVEPDTTQLSSYVDSLKEKYGDRWRKEMDSAESEKFNKLQQDLLYANMEKEFIPKRRASDLTVADVLKMEEAEPYTKAQIEANFPDRVSGPDITQEVKVSPDVTQPIPIVKAENIPPAPPEIIKGEPPPSQPPKKLRLTSLTAAERASLPGEVNIAKANPIASQAEKSYRQYHEVEASKAIGSRREITSGLNKEQQARVIKYMRGQDVVLSPDEMSRFSELRKLTEKVAKEAGDEGVLTGKRKDYFPEIIRRIADMEKETTLSFDDRLGGKKYGHLEKPRTKQNADVIENFEVLDQYFDRAYRRIAEAKFLGKTLEKVGNISGDPDTLAYYKAHFKGITGPEPARQVARTLGKVRHITALGDLATTSILQAGQGVHTASFTGLRRSARAAVAMLKDMKGEELNAIKSGALWPHISHEVGQALGTTGSKGWRSYMHGVPTVDKVMRIHANIAGRFMLEAAKSGKDSKAAGRLREIGIKDFNSPDAANLAGKLISDKTQFRADFAHVPQWTTTPYGKVAFQYNQFAYAHARFMMDMLKNPIKNWGQIARMAGLGLIAGEILGDTRAAVKAAIPGKGEDDEIMRRMLEAAAGDPAGFDSKSFLEKLQAATRSRRIPTSSLGWRAIQNLSLIGGAGIFQSLLEKAVDPKRYPELPIGPSGTMLVETGMAAAKDVQNKNIRESSKNLIQNAPIPFVDKYKLANTLLPPKRKRRRY